MNRYFRIITLVLSMIVTQITFADTNVVRKYVKVLDSHISYLEGGEGKTVLFIHGVPTYSYLWRNVLPPVAASGNHVIAIDLIGHGYSGKPFIEYGLQDHLRYLEAFITKLNLKDITLVLHDWGTAIGFIYASKHPENIKGLAFMEAMLGPVPDKSMMPPIAIQMRGSAGWNLVVENNFFLETMLPMMSMVPLSKEAIKAYHFPFKTKASRRALRMWPLEVPIAGVPEENHALFENYAKYLMTTETPKLLLYSTPGVLTQENQANFVRNNYKNASVVNVGAGLHFIQEENPQEVSNNLLKWLGSL